MPAGVNAYVALANVTLSSAVSTVNFTSISQSYRDLVLVFSGRLDSNSAKFTYYINGNEGVSNIYNFVYALGDGSATGSGAAGNQYEGFTVGGSYSNLTNTGLQTVSMQFLDYSATDKDKPILIRTDSYAQNVNMAAARYGSSGAITSLRFRAGGNSFAAGSTFALFGVSA